MEDNFAKRKEFFEIFKSIKSEFKKTMNSSRLIDLLLLEKSLEALNSYNFRKNHSIFKDIFEKINDVNFLTALVLTKDLLNIFTDFGRSEIVNLEDFDIDFLFKISDIEAKNQMLWTFVEIWAVNKAKDYETLKEQILLQCPSLKVLLLAKENKFNEFVVEFEVLSGDYFSDRCLAIAEVASKNLNQDILAYLIFHENLSQDLKLRIVVLVCKSGLHEILQNFFASMGSKCDVKEMMIEVFKAIMMRKTCRKRSFKEVFLPEVNHYLCFHIIFKHKREIAFEFMKQALDADYEDIVLLFIKNGYYIGRKDKENNSFLNTCKNKNLLVKILNSCVSLEQNNGRYLKIDYRFLFDSLENRKVGLDQISVEANSEKENFRKCSCLNVTEFLWKFLNFLNLTFFYLLMFLYSWTTTNFYILCLAYITLRTFVKLAIHVNTWRLRTRPRKSSFISVKSFYNFMDYSFDLLLIVLVALVSGIFYEVDKSVLGVAYPILLVLTGVEAILLLEPLSKEDKVDDENSKPLQMIAHSKYFKSTINHPVLATYIEIMDQEFQMYYICNCWIFVISSLVLVSWIVYPFSENLFPYYSCPLYIGIRESIQMFLFGRKYFSSVVNWIEFGLILSGFVGYWNESDEDRTIFNVATAIMIIAAVVELLILLSKICKDILDIVTMFTKVILMYLKLILMFGFVLVGFTLSFMLIFSTPNDKDNSNDSIETDFIISSNNSELSLPNNINKFQKFDYSLLKVLLMLTGEFDASNIVIYNLYHLSFFFIFVFVAVTIFNFINALAIGEVQNLKKISDSIILKEKLGKICFHENFKSRVTIYREAYKCFYKIWTKCKRNGSMEDKLTIKYQMEIYIDCQELTVWVRDGGAKLRLGNINSELYDRLVAVT